MMLCIFNEIFMLYFVLLVNIDATTQSDIYVSTAEIGYLIRTRQKVINELHLYIDAEEKKLTNLKRYYDLNKRENEKAMKNISYYINNPINAFITIKSLSVDLNHVKYLIKRAAELAELVSVKHASFVYPTLEDLTGSAQGLSRLVKMYRLDLKELAEGRLNKEQSSSSSPMSASDCFVLGRTLYKDGDYETAIPWIEEAYRKYNEENIPYQFTDIDILEYISYGYYKKGDIEKATHWTQKILKIDPNQQKAKQILSAYIKRMANEKKNNLELEGQSKETGKPLLEECKVEIEKGKQLFVNYEEMCRGELDVPIQVYSRLTCRYLTESNPYLKIAPVKMELKYLNPDVVLFHNVVSDREIEIMKRLALPKFQRANVSTAGPSIDNDFRISKATWFRDNQFDTIQRVSRRVAQITGLSLERSKDTQVCNYGVGGHFLPHFDPHDVSNRTYVYHGRRIATAMLYLSDVAQGGATVFPRLGVRVTPMKGAAIFWFNLHASGEINHATLHAACPVLEGSKWVCNKWIFQAGQELRRPCDLQYQPEGYDTAIVPEPVLKISRDRSLFEEYKSPVRR